MAGPISLISIRSNPSEVGVVPLDDLGFTLEAAGAAWHDLDTLEELRIAARSHQLRDLATDASQTTTSTVIINTGSGGAGSDIPQADVPNFLANLLTGDSTGGSGGDAYAVAKADSSGNFDMAGGAVSNIAAATASGQAVEYDQFIALVAGADSKGSVKALSDVPIGTLSGLPTTVDGIGSWSAGELILLVGEGVTETTTILAVADVAGSLSGKYFTYSSIDEDYYVWIDVDNGSTDPNIAGKTGIEVNIAANATAPTVAAAIQAAMDAVGDIVATVSTSTVTADPTKAGNTTDAADVDAGFTVTTTVQGTGGLLGGHANNGIWEVQSGAWTRPTLFAAGQSAESAFTHVAQGTIYADKKFLCTNDDPNAVIDTDALIFSDFPLGGAGVSGYRSKLQWGKGGVRIPDNTLPFYLNAGSVSGGFLGERMNNPGEITGLSVEAFDDSAETNTYQLEIYLNGVETAVASLSYAAASGGAYVAGLSVAFNAGDVITAAIRRTAGTGKSHGDHKYFRAIVDVTESA